MIQAELAEVPARALPQRVRQWLNLKLSETCPGLRFTFTGEHEVAAEQVAELFFPDGMNYEVVPRPGDSAVVNAYLHEKGALVVAFPRDRTRVTLIPPSMFVSEITEGNILEFFSAGGLKASDIEGWLGINGVKERLQRFAEA